MVNILILNWESSESTRECLKSILLSDNHNFRVILINNFSTIADQDVIDSVYDSYKDKIEIYLIKNSSNLGYAGGNNSGVKFLAINKFSGDVLIINPDILISGSTISEMGMALTGNTGIVSIRTRDPEGKILFDAIKLKGYFRPESNSY
jgi:GT2 family glycosyltransferase